MKSTFISYDFFYRDNKPWFFSMTIGIYEGEKTLFHESCMTCEEECSFLSKLNEMETMGFQQGSTYSNGNDVHSINFHKTFES